MAEVPAPASVSLSRCPGSETPRHPGFRRDSGAATAGSPGLKALARLVLTRDSRRDTERDRVSRAPTQIETSGTTLPAGETIATTSAVARAERAAIVEHDSATPRAWAEDFARLDPDRPPGDVPLKRWQRFVDDVRRFLDSPFCAIAAAMGWGPFDLFGFDGDRPFARIDRAGLLWLLNGDRLVMLADDAATIETRTGVRQTWRRKPSVRGRVLVWELAR
jgi:hypothetical protein